MGLEKFEKNSFRGTAESEITLRESGSIGISKVAMEEYFGDVDGVVLYGDNENNRIGLEPSDPDEDPDAYKLSRNNGSGSVAAKSFMKRYNIVPEETTAYEPEWDGDEGLLFVDLDSPKDN